MKQKLWNFEREALLLTKSNEYNKEWYLVADAFPGLDASQIKNKYYKIMKRDRNRETKLLRESIEQILDSYQ